MKNKDLQKFQEGLNSVAGLKGVNFALVVVRNQKKVEAALEELKGAYKQLPKMQEYEAKRIELAKTYSEKNEDGSPKVFNNQFVLENIEAFQEEFADLQVEYADTIREQTEIDAEFAELLDQESEVEVSKVATKHLPEDLSAAQIEAIFEMIAED